MQIPNLDSHLWTLADHFLAALSYAIPLFFWLKRRFKRLLKEAVVEAIRQEMGETKTQVAEMYPWYQIVSRAFGTKKANGHAVGAS